MLDPFLFNMHIHDIFQVIWHGTLSLYADEVKSIYNFYSSTVQSYRFRVTVLQQTPLLGLYVFSHSEKARKLMDLVS